MDFIIEFYFIEIPERLLNVKMSLKFHMIRVNRHAIILLDYTLCRSSDTSESCWKLKAHS